jgi:hypothetical protein
VIEKQHLYIEDILEVRTMINTTRLRCLIGGLGMSIAIIVVVLSLLNGLPFPDSISETYFREPCITPFMVILGSAGVLLIGYAGYEEIDDILCTLAGFFGWGVCLFPCYSSADADGLIGTF